MRIQTRGLGLSERNVDGVLDLKTPPTWRPGPMATTSRRGPRLMLYTLPQGLPDVARYIMHHTLKFEPSSFE